MRRKTIVLPKLLWNRLALFVVALSLFSHSPLHAQRQGREFGVNFGFGLGGSYSVLKGSTDSSSFRGWSPGIEAGLDLPWSRKSGLFISGGIRQVDLTNTSTKSNFVERMEGSSKFAKLGLFVGQLGFGGGISEDTFEIRQVSAISGESSKNIEGTTTLMFINYNFEIDPQFRLTFEGLHQSGDLMGFGFTDIGAMMKFVMLFEL